MYLGHCARWLTAQGMTAIFNAAMCSHMAFTYLYICMVIIISQIINRFRTRFQVLVVTQTGNHNSLGTCKSVFFKGQFRVYNFIEVAMLNTMKLVINMNPHLLNHISQHLKSKVSLVHPFFTIIRFETKA